MQRRENDLKERLQKQEQDFNQKKDENDKLKKENEELNKIIDSNSFMEGFSINESYSSIARVTSEISSNVLSISIQQPQDSVQKS